MVHCWEEYMWKVHKALPMDPWADNLQLLDVLIQDRTWLPAWLRPKSRERTRLSRAGSIFHLGTKDSLVKAQDLVDGDRKLSRLQASDGAINPQLPSLQSPTNNNNSATAAAAAAATAAAPPLVSIISSSMPDIQASIKTSTSLLGSFTGGSFATSQFDVKGSKSISGNVSGVQSRRVDVDALLRIVTPRTSSALPALWQPDISLPQLCWPSKRGQTLWVVAEIMYANKIRIEGENQGQTKANTEVKATKVEEASMSTEVGTQKNGLWMVMASKDNPMFPLAFRLQRLDYDAFGNLISKGHKKHLQRNSSMNTKLSKPLVSSKHVAHPLSRSLSVSPVLS
ncbi:hypothetical protein GOP47_0020885 [Adiantum capillus-veneris]|uniref:Uncharacterized protein n=1 Tax=Adiantum capillus-veneris TaxID=13818 RepID=A0A9D4UAJ1_ADICA|nr:hypothetical protein GOP47_0020885 [Adiantum capillus-veneris]